MPEEKFCRGQIGQDFGQGVLRRVGSVKRTLHGSEPPVTASAFRQHDQVPARIESALFRQLVTEWVSLNALTAAAAAVHKLSLIHI